MAKSNVYMSNSDKKSASNLVWSAYDLLQILNAGLSPKDMSALYSKATILKDSL